MLIPDLLNILFDQANYHGLIVMRSLNKRRTKYANKYSVLSQYNDLDMRKCGADIVSLLREIIDCGCSLGRMKYLANVVSANIRVNDDFALRFSAKRGEILVVKYLVSIGADIHATDKSYLGIDTLQVSAYNGHLNVVKYLVSIGANIHANKKSCYCEKSCGTALIIGAANGHLEVVKYLVSVGADVHAKNNRALRWGALGHLEVVKYLVSVGADVHAKNEEALRNSLESTYWLELTKYLISVGANINVDNDYLFDASQIVRDNFSHLKKT